MRVGQTISLNKHIDLEIPHGRVLTITLFLVLIKGILVEQGCGVNGSPFADNIRVYITTIKINGWCTGVHLDHHSRITAH